jgi:TRAP-type uncharacterized transport system fused permease subunit
MIPKPLTIVNIILYPIFFLVIIYGLVTAHSRLGFIELVGQAIPLFALGATAYIGFRRSLYWRNAALIANAISVCFFVLAAFLLFPAISDEDSVSTRFLVIVFSPVAVFIINSWYIFHSHRAPSHDRG